MMLIGCDHATKMLAKTHLKDKAPQSWYHDTFRLEYVENTGAFLSLGADWPKGVSFIAMGVLPLLFLMGLLVYAIRKTNSRSLMAMIPYILIFSGGVGNIADRIIYDRHVTDFMNLGINEWRTGIFNVADLYVTSGVIMLLISQFKKNREQPVPVSSSDNP
jgi:signal peptidase II